MSPNLAFILVPGAWHPASTWDKVVAGLATHGHRATAVTLPTTLSDPAASYADDVRAVREHIVAETTQGRDVVLVVHSYGGAVGSSAIRGLTGTHGSSGAAPGHVIGFLMIASGFMTTGATFLDRVGGKPLPFWEEDSDPGFATLCVPAGDFFYHDLPADEAALWVSRLQRHSTRAFREGADVSYAGWRDVPVWYLVTTDDRALAPEAQRGFIHEAVEAGGDVTVREVASSHSPMLSRPGEAVGFILEAAAALAKVD